MTPCSSPVRDVSGQEDCLDPAIISEDHQQKQQQRQPEENDEPQKTDSPAEQLPTHGQVAHAVAELEGLSLDIDTFTKGKSEVVKAVSDEEEKKNAGPEPPVSSFDDSEGGSQTSSEESWASFPSSGSNSTDSNSDAEEEGEERSAPGPGAHDSLPSPEALFKFHEEFGGGGDEGVDGTGGPELPPGEEFTMGEDEEDLPSPMQMPMVPIPRWVFLQSSNTLPILGLGPGDFHHGGSALRHEVSAEDDDDEDAGLDDDGKSSRWSREIANVGVVHL